MAPQLQLPESPNTVRVRMFDATTNMVVGARDFVEPVLAGHETFNLTTVGFVIENTRLGKKAVFDLGCRKDYWKASPAQAARLERIMFGIRVDKDCDEILTEAGIDVASIDSLIWSHMHWDHVGNTARWPKRAEIVVGRGFTKAFLPAYPSNPDSRLFEAYFEGRHLEEIGFSQGLHIGDFEAHDFFGDGSFYLLNAPGHCIGHMCGLARTTPNTFVFMGGDICHAPGMFRPTNQVGMPDPIPSSTSLDSYFPSPCPCSIFDTIHPVQDKEEAHRSPFYGVTHSDHSSYVDREQAIKDIRKLQDFDASPNVLVCIAHDRTLLEAIPLLNDDPSVYINDWKEKGYKEKAQWGFLNELPRNGKRGRKEFIEGWWREGKQYQKGEPMNF